jgi:hypothetical protein
LKAVKKFEIEQKQQQQETREKNKGKWETTQAAF